MNHYVLDVTARLRASGDVVALVHSRTPKSEFRGTGYIFDHLRKMEATPDEVMVRLEAIVDDFKPDIIQLHGVPNLLLDPWLAARAPTVRWIHNHRFYCSGEAMTWAWPRRACGRAHGVGCLAAHVLHGCGSPDPVRNLARYRDVSGSLAALRRLPGLQVASRMMAENLIRNGIDPARVEHLPLYAAPAPESKKPLMGQRRFILHPGGLVHHKGIWLLVRRIAQLPGDVDLVFAGGSGRLERALGKYVARHALSGRVRIIGEVSPAKWSQLFTEATLVVMPSLWNEPLGLAGLYAMAHGKPIVAFRGGGIGEWLVDGETGVAVPFGDKEAFLAAVVRLLGDPKRLQTLGAQAQQTWEARFRPEPHLAALRVYYARLVHARRNT